MSKLISPRLGSFKILIGVALLRELKASGIWLNWTEEALDGILPQAALIPELKLRVLYRLRFLSEQLPLDLISFQYCLPLILEILHVHKRNEEVATQDEEQITLALEFINFEASLAANVMLPRVDLIQKLLDILSYVPGVFKLAKEAFLQVADAISVNESKEESAALVHGLLNPAANVRNVVLQALESFDLDETETPEILFLAIHDSDERNAEIAKAIYHTNKIQLDSYSLSRNFLLLGNPSGSKTKNRKRHTLRQRDGSQSFGNCALSHA
jgi:hypothetical protein